MISLEIDLLIVATVWLLLGVIGVVYAQRTKRYQKRVLDNGIERVVMVLFGPMALVGVCMWLARNDQGPYSDYPGFQ